MRFESTDRAGVTPATDEIDDGSSDYRRTVLTLRVVKLTLGILVSALTALRLLGVI